MCELKNSPYLDKRLRCEAEALLARAVNDWPQFDNEHEPVSGADLVDWFAEFRRDVKAAIEAAKRT